MSGRPNVPDISAVLEHLARLQVLGTEIDELEKQVGVLRDRKQEQQQRSDAVRKLLEGMDLMDTGNYGHLDRLAVFVAEMRRQMGEARR